MQSAVSSRPTRILAAAAGLVLLAGGLTVAALLSNGAQADGAQAESTRAESTRAESTRADAQSPPPGAMAAEAVADTAAETAAETSAETSETPHFTEVERARIGELVRDYIMANPGIVMEAAQKHQIEQRQAQRRRGREALADLRDEITANGIAPVAGNPQGKVTVVEFFDYQCGYCKRAHGTVTRLIDSNDQVRFVYKEFPVLGEASVFAARVALAAAMQDPEAYHALHDALMEMPRLSEDRILEAARAQGLDMERLGRDMEGDEVQAAIAHNRELAGQLGITGTPGFVIGDEIVPGAVPYERMQSLVDRQLSQAPGESEPGESEAGEDGAGENGAGESGSRGDDRG